MAFIALAGLLLSLAAPAVLSAAGPAASGTAAAAQEMLKERSKELGLEPTDIREARISSLVPSPHNGITHVYFQQLYRGIEVRGGVINMSLKGRSPVTFGSRFVAGLAGSAGDQSALLTATEAAEAALAHLQIQPTEPMRLLSFEGGAEETTLLTDGGVASRPIEARLTWVPTGRNVRLAWRIEIDQLGGEHWWQAYVDAGTGADLGQDDLVIHDPLTVARRDDGDSDGDSDDDGGDPGFPPTDGAVYNVFPLPFESPTDGPRELVENAADPAASPFGWHDTDGAAGAEFTVTRGNNVHAYTDLDADNVADPGSDPDGGAALSFDFPLDLSLGPDTYRPAAVTNLFYWNNIVHDVAFGFGFDEASGNFQETNYGGLGLGGDYVRAEAQDGSGTNNANFATPSDGNRPRMQMFVWTHPTPNFVRINGGPIAGDFTASRASFGPQLPDVGPITADVTLVDDASGASTTDGCEPFVGFPSGNIALLDRGSCTFVIKVLNAQAAGAVGVIVANNAAGTITMGGADPTVAIPSVMVSIEIGDLFKANLPFNATLVANPTLSINRDSDLDAGVIAHEYGHGISNRLTGGPGIVNCLRNAEQMGEGWSDWQALTFTTEPSDNPLTVRGVGTYVIFQGEDGNGIRPTPYSTDLAVNPSTYASVADVANISQPHGIGYVWNSMLWEVYW
ncbi:MAG: M36 family metallopeptidase, partial [Acidobacteria bacterium]|nr:M36 family metallopeptidase [Acidobacteriota bacterium]